MRKLTILHAADLHLDSPFEGLPAGKAAIRREEQRELLARLAELAFTEHVDLVLLAGDLLDSGNTYYETGEELIRALRGIGAPVFIAPGNHDFYSARSPYARLHLPDNVHVFTERGIRSVILPELGTRVFGAAFTDRVYQEEPEESAEKLLRHLRSILPEAGEQQIRRFLMGKESGNVQG